MPKSRTVYALLAAGLFTAALQGCASLPGAPSSGNGGTGKVFRGWFQDMVADLGFGSMVSTRIADAPPVVPWLEGLADEVSPVEGESFDLEPGYYRFSVESFCLDPGAYGPGPSEGHLLAPLSGQRARLVQSILSRAGDHPDVPQHAIQRFLWGIDAGLTLPEFPEQVRNQIQPLLTSQEALQLTVDAGEIAGFLASQFLSAEGRGMVDRFQKMRALLVDVQASYQALEQVAVLLGTTPPGPGSRKVAVGQWSYAGDGFYARTIPESYSSTILEVLRPAPYQLERDRLGRIVRFESGAYRIDATYDDRPARNVVRGPNGEEGRIWHFKRLKFSGPRPGETHVIRNSGWIVAPEPTSNLLALFKNAGNSHAVSRRSKDAYVLAQNMYASNGLMLAEADWKRRINHEWIEYRNRVKQGKKVYDDAKQYREELDRATRPVDEQAIRDLTDLKHFRDGVKAASKPTDLEGKQNWLRDHGGRLRNAWSYTNCVLAGDCPPPGMEEDPFRRRFDPSGVVSVPSNTSRQPLGLTRRIVGR